MAKMATWFLLVGILLTGLMFYAYSDAGWLSYRQATRVLQVYFLGSCAVFVTIDIGLRLTRRRS